MLAEFAFLNISIIKLYNFFAYGFKTVFIYFFFIYSFLLFLCLKELFKVNISLFFNYFYICFRIFLLFDINL